MTDKSTLSNRQTLEQQRAAKAWEQTESVSKQQLAEYISLVEGLPARVQIDGLGQTLAFLRAKAKDKNGNYTHHWTAYLFLQEWLSGRFENVKPGLLEWLMNQDSDIYRQVSVEAQSYMIWLKRFAEAKSE